MTKLTYTTQHLKVLPIVIDQSNNNQANINYRQQFQRIVYKRLLLNNLLVFILQFSGLALSSLSSELPFIWFASGTACAFCFLKGMRILPGIYLGSWLAYYLSSANFILASLLSLFNVLQPSILLWISYKFNYPSLLFYQKKPLIRFIFMTIILTGIISVCFSTLCFPFLRHSILSFYQMWLCWWLANLNGTVIFSFLLIFCDAYFPASDSLSNKSLLIFSLYCTLIIIITLSILFSKQPISIIFLSLFLFMLIQIFSYIHGQFSLIIMLFIAGFIFGMSHLYHVEVWNTSFAFQTTLYLQIIFFLSYLTSFLISDVISKIH